MKIKSLLALASVPEPTFIYVSGKLVAGEEYCDFVLLIDFLWDTYIGRQRGSQKLLHGSL